MTDNESHPDLAGAIEAVLFAAAEPMTLQDLRKVFTRLWQDEPEEQRSERLEQLPAAITKLAERWSDRDGARGFLLSEVAKGYAFRSNPMFADAIAAMREQRPIRLSRAALETLAIIAYRQPATKPEIDHIRGVDCGGTIRLLLDRDLVRIVGKKEEPGRPLLYGTTRQFLSFFNLRSLSDLPTLREFHELNEDSQEELARFEGVTVEELSNEAKKFRLDDEPEVEALDDALQNLRATEKATKQSLEEQGIRLSEEEEPPSAAQGDTSSNDDAATSAAEGEPSAETPPAESSAAPEEPSDSP